MGFGFYYPGTFLKGEGQMTVTPSGSFFPEEMIKGNMREPAAGLVMRPLDSSDLDKGFIALLGQVRMHHRRALPGAPAYECSSGTLLPPPPY